MKTIIIKPEGNNMMQLQRNLFEKLYAELCRHNITEFTVNVAVGAVLMDLSEYRTYPRTVEDVNEIQDNPRNKYPIGMLNGINVFVDPMMQWSDNRVIGEEFEATIDMDSSLMI